VQRPVRRRPRWTPSDRNGSVTEPEATSALRAPVHHGPYTASRSPQATADRRPAAARSPRRRADRARQQVRSVGPATVRVDGEVRRVRLDQEQLGGTSRSAARRSSLGPNDTGPANEQVPPVPRPRAGQLGVPEKQWNTVRSGAPSAQQHVDHVVVGVRGRGSAARGPSSLASATCARNASRCTSRPAGRPGSGRGPSRRSRGCAGSRGRPPPRGQGVVEARACRGCGSGSSPSGRPRGRPRAARLVGVDGDGTEQLGPSRTSSSVHVTASRSHPTCTRRVTPTAAARARWSSSVGARLRAVAGCADDGPLPVPSSAAPHRRPAARPTPAPTQVRVVVDDGRGQRLGRRRPAPLRLREPAAPQPAAAVELLLDDRVVELGEHRHGLRDRACPAHRLRPPRRPSGQLVVAGDHRVVARVVVQVRDLVDPRLRRERPVPPERLVHGLRGECGRNGASSVFASVIRLRGRVQDRAEAVPVLPSASTARSRRCTGWPPGPRASPRRWPPGCGARPAGRRPCRTPADVASRRGRPAAARPPRGISPKFLWIRVACG
jgi:hypothetical protein